MKKVITATLMALLSSTAFANEQMVNEFVQANPQATNVKVDVDGMVCSYCSSTLYKQFKPLTSAVKVDLEEGLVLLSFDKAKTVDVEQIKEIIINAGTSPTDVEFL